jgi:tetratricopeptide (TPR) repeat protein
MSREERGNMSPRGLGLVSTVAVTLATTVMLAIALPARGGGAPGAKGDGVTPLSKSEMLKKIDGAIAKSREEITADPADASAHARLGYLLIRKGSLDEAMKFFDEALKLNPRLYDAKTGKGIVLARKGNFGEAEQVLKEALVLNPNPVRTHYELGLLYERLNDFEKAAAEFKEGIRKHEQGRL